MGTYTQAATAAEKVDSIFLFVFALSVAFLIAITGVMIYFVIRYSRKRNPKPSPVGHHTLLEVTWTVVPLLLFLAIFYYGWTDFSYIRNAPRDAMVVDVTARQWSWSFKYPNGKQTTELYAVVNRPVKVDLRSVDVIHGFFIPAFRIKMDVVPGRVNSIWFQPTKLGSYDIECTVICGTGHSYMLSKVVVVTEEDFKRWYFGGEDAPPPGPPAQAAGTAPGAGAP